MAVWTALGEPEQLLATSNRPEVWAALPLAGRFCVEAGEVVRG